MMWHYVLFHYIIGFPEGEEISKKRGKISAGVLKNVYT